MSWHVQHVYVTCSLCSARTRSFSHDEAAEAGAAACAAAIELGFVELPDVREEGRRRSAGYLCAACLVDVAALAAPPAPRGAS